MTMTKDASSLTKLLNSRVLRRRSWCQVIRSLERRLDSIGGHLVAFVCVTDIGRGRKFIPLLLGIDLYRGYSR